jgi:hypothetical protein
MQLRVARLCLDCEELHVADTCPVCASESYAFLAAWLPSEERRRWPRGRVPAAEPAPHGVRRLFGAIAHWWSGEPAERPALRTRASDHVPRLDFEPPVKEPQRSPSLEPQPAQPTQKPGA